MTPVKALSTVPESTRLKYCMSVAGSVSNTRVCPSAMDEVKTAWNSGRPMLVADMSIVILLAVMGVGFSLLIIII